MGAIGQSGVSPSRSPPSSPSARPSPVRDEIAFVSDRDGSSDVFLADLGAFRPEDLHRVNEPGADLEKYRLKP